jgi:quercetin dioxygenase-like cupin family protein
VGKRSALTKEAPALARLRAATVAEKPWGREFHYVGDNRLSMRMLEIKEGHSLIPARHGNDIESLCVIAGHVWFHLNGYDFEVLPGAYVTLEPDDLYHLEASTNTLILIAAPSSAPQ